MLPLPPKKHTDTKNMVGRFRSLKWQAQLWDSGLQINMLYLFRADTNSTPTYQESLQPQGFSPWEAWDWT